VTRHGQPGAGRLFPPWIAVVILLVGGITAAGTAGITLFGGLATSAVADPISSCSTTTGVIVAVDFSHWEGNVERGCDATLTNGWQALVEAGFAPTYVSEYAPGAFVCQITDPATAKAEPADTQCATTPPASAYWSFWYANAGQNAWTYSQQGALSFEPRPGSVDAWTFGGTNLAGTDGQPQFSPSAVRATTPGPTQPPSTTSTTTTPAPVPPIPPSTLAKAAPSLPGSTATTPKKTDVTTRSAPTRTSLAPGSTVKEVGPPGKSAKSRPARRSARPDPTTIGAIKTAAGRSSSSSVPKIVNVAAGPAGPHPSSGSPVAFIIGAVLVAALGIGGGIMAWRRRPVA
jgi:hypothetical protein